VRARPLKGLHDRHAEVNLLDRLSVLFVRHLFFLLFFVLKALRREIRVLVPEMPHDPRWKAALDLAV
jgi:hypothetical protein